MGNMNYGIFLIMDNAGFISSTVVIAKIDAPEYNCSSSRRRESNRGVRLGSGF